METQKKITASSVALPDKPEGGKAVWWGLGFLTVVYTALVLVRHFSFDTQAYDLSIFDEGVWHYNRFQAPYSSIRELNLLSDHFTPILMLAAPFYWLWNGPETLLVLQVLGYMSGVVPAYWLARKYLQTNLQYYPPFFYALFFGAQSALNFDFHTDTLAAVGFMWAIWAFEAGYTWRYLAFWGVVLMCKETFPAYMSFWALYVLVTRWREPFQRYLHIGMFIGGFGLFFAEQNLIMPFVGGQAYPYTDYGELGHSLGEVIVNSVKDPGKLFNALFGETSKRWLWVAFFLAPGGALFFRPALLLVLLPNVIERFLNPAPQRWTLLFHYNVILVPFFTLAVVLALASYEKHRGRWGKFYLPKSALVIWLQLVLLINTVVLGNFLTSSLDNFNLLFQDRSAVWEALRQVPADKSVLASERLVPHLPQRENVNVTLLTNYIPLVPNTDYVIISLQVDREPESIAGQTIQVNLLRQRSDYELIYEREQNYVFRRVGERKPGPLWVVLDKPYTK